jgi:DnaJ-class molecular chaperone
MMLRKEAGGDRSPYHAKATAAHEVRSQARSRFTAMAQDLYKILGIDMDATQDQIKAAYRSKAKHLHPDRSKGSSAPFRALQQAYEVLCDPAKRRRYDRERMRAHTVVPTRSSVEPSHFRGQPTPEPLIPTRRPFDRRDVFFDGPLSVSHDGLLESLREAQLWPQAGPSDEIHVRVVLSPQQAARGGRARLLLPIELECPACRGRGHDWFFECRRCWGAGTLAWELPIEIELPPQVAHSSTATLALSRPGMPEISVTLHFTIDRW